MSELAQQLVNGLMIGCLYALIAVGYTMVYGIIELINFAFGELFMFGAFITIMMMSDEISPLRRHGQHARAQLLPGHPHRHGGRGDHGRRHRAAGLPAPAQRASPRGAHLGHRRLDPAAERGPVHLRLPAGEVPGHPAVHHRGRRAQGVHRRRRRDHLLPGVRGGRHRRRHAAAQPVRASARGWAARCAPRRRTRAPRRSWASTSTR